MLLAHQEKTSQLHLNTGQHLIVVTEDKVRLYLHKHLDRVGQRQAWLAPLGIVLTLVLTFVTTTFQPFIVPAATWQAFFMFGLVAALLWLVTTLRYLFVRSSIDDVVKELMEESKARTPP